MGKKQVDAHNREAMERFRRWLGEHDAKILFAVGESGEPPTRRAHIVVSPDLEGISQLEGVLRDLLKTLETGPVIPIDHQPNPEEN